MVRWELLCATCVVLLAGCGEELVDSDGPGPGDALQLAITLRYKGPVYQGTFYNGFLPSTDHAVWIVDSQGKYVKTLQVSESAVTVGEHGSHVSHLPVWSAASGETDALLAARTDTGESAVEYDGITSASTTFYNAAKNDVTPVSDTTRTFVWDLTDSTGTRVADGLYRFCAEASNIKKDSVGVDPYPPDSILHEDCCGSLSIVDSVVTPALPTTHITELSGQLQ